MARATYAAPRDAHQQPPPPNPRSLRGPNWPLSFAKSLSGPPEDRCSAAQAVFSSATRPKRDSRSQWNDRRNRRLERSRLTHGGWRRLRRQVRQRGARIGGADHRLWAVPRFSRCLAAGWLSGGTRSGKGRPRGRGRPDEGGPGARSGLGRRVAGGVRDSRGRARRGCEVPSAACEGGSGAGRAWLAAA